MLISISKKRASSKTIKSDERHVLDYNSVKIASNFLLADKETRKTGAKMKALILFFSGTGNTWWCARQLAEALQTRGIYTSIHSIEQAIPDVDFDLLGLGWPVYGSDLPLPMTDFIQTRLPAPSADQKLFTFCTQYMFSGDGAWIAQAALSVKNWQIRWAAHFLMPNNICVPQSPFAFSGDYTAHQTRLKKTTVKISAFANAISEDLPFSQGKSKASLLLGRLQRDPYRKYFPLLRDDISIDRTVCKLCGRCVAICPSGNLRQAADETGLHIASQGNCVLCVRCYNFCPVQAVLYRGRRHPAKRGLPYRGPTPDFQPEQLTGSGRTSL